MSGISEIFPREYRRDSFRIHEGKPYNMLERLLQKSLEDLVWNLGVVLFKVLKRFHLNYWRDSVRNHVEISHGSLERSLQVSKGDLV